MIHRNQKVAQSRRRDHHRAGGAGAVAVEAVAVEAGAARAGEAEKPSEMGAPGSLNKGMGTSPPVVDSSSEASSDGEANKGHPDHRGDGRAWVQPMKLGLARRASGMELSVRLARCEIKSIPSLLMAPHVLIAMMTRRMLGAMSPYCNRTDGDVN